MFDLTGALKSTQVCSMFANASQLGMASDASEEAIKSKFSIGSQHTVRVTGVRMLTRLLHGTCNARALKLPFVGIEDANAGDRCTMIVRGASLNVGVIGHLEHTTTRCRIPLMHALSSSTQRRNLEALNARFPKGSICIGCRSNCFYSQAPKCTYECCRSTTCKCVLL